MHNALNYKNPRKIYGKVSKIRTNCAIFYPVFQGALRNAIKFKGGISLKICVIGYDHPLGDKRVLSSVLTLAQDNSVIYIYKDTNENDESLVRKFERMGVKLIGVRKLGNGLFYRKEFDHELLKRCFEEECEVIYTHGFAITAPLKFFKLFRARGKKIIYDIHEYVPHNFLESLPFPRSVIYMKRWIMERIFQKQLSLVDGIVAISRLQMEKIVSLVGDGVKPVLFLPNAAFERKETLGLNERRRVLTMVGKTPKRLEILKSFVEEIRLRIPDLKVEIIGVRSSEALPRDAVRYESAMSYEDMMSRLQRSLFGLMIYRTYKYNSLNDRWSLPNKFFDTLAAGTPVIVDSYFSEMASWVEEFGVGLVVDPIKDPVGSAEKVVKTLVDGRYENFLINIKKHQERFTMDLYRSQLCNFVREVCLGRKRT